MAVHHVDVDPVGAGLVDRAHFLAQPGEIGREDRGGDADGLLHAWVLTLPESRRKERARLIPRIVERAPAFAFHGLLDGFGPNDRGPNRRPGLSSRRRPTFERSRTEVSASVGE